MSSQDDRDLRAAERAHDRSKELQFKLVDAATRDAQEAMKVALAINGGAAIAVLAFLGAFGSRDAATLVKMTKVFYSLLCFAGGVFAAAITSALAYFSNSFYAANHAELLPVWHHPYLLENTKSKRYLKWARICNWAAVTFAIAAVVAFVVGIIFVATGLIGLR